MLVVKLSKPDANIDNRPLSAIVPEDALILHVFIVESEVFVRNLISLTPLDWESKTMLCVSAVDEKVFVPVHVLFKGIKLAPTTESTYCLLVR